MEKQTEMKFKIFGYDQYQEIDLRPYIINIAKFLINIPDNREITGYTISELRMLKDTKSILESLSLRLHNVKIASIEELTRNMTCITTIEQALSIINSLIKEANPLEIPRILIPGHSMVGETQKPIILIDDDEYLSKCPIIFSVIQLGRNLTKLSTGTYIHEITHSQLESLKGSVKNYQNKEVLPIFMERVVAYKQDPKLLKIANRMRLRHLLESLIVLNYAYNGTTIAEKDRIESEIYVISTLKALKLYDLYAKANETVKKEILIGIQAIFDQKQTLEDFLVNFDITNQSSLNNDSIKRNLP